MRRGALLFARPALSPGRKGRVMLPTLVATSVLRLETHHRPPVAVRKLDRLQNPSVPFRIVRAPLASASAACQAAGEGNLGRAKTFCRRAGGNPAHESSRPEGQVVPVRPGRKGSSFRPFAAQRPSLKLGHDQFGFIRVSACLVSLHRRPRIPRALGSALFQAGTAALRQPEGYMEIEISSYKTTIIHVCIFRLTCVRNTDFLSIEQLAD